MVCIAVREKDKEEEEDKEKKRKLSQKRKRKRCWVQDNNIICVEHKMCVCSGKREKEKNINKEYIISVSAACGAHFVKI